MGGSVCVCVKRGLAQLRAELIGWKCSGNTGWNAGRGEGEGEGQGGWGRGAGCGAMQPHGTTGPGGASQAALRASGLRERNAAAAGAEEPEDGCVRPGPACLRLVLDPFSGCDCSRSTRTRTHTHPLETQQRHAVTKLSDAVCGKLVVSPALHRTQVMMMMRRRRMEDEVMLVMTGHNLASFSGFIAGVCGARTRTVCVLRSEAESNRIRSNFSDYLTC